HVFGGMLATYDWTLRRVIRHRFLTLVVSALVLVATAYLFVKIPKGFIPNQDTNQIFGFTEAAQDISFDSMVQHQLQVADVLRHDPNILQFSSSVGAGGPNAAANTGRVFARLKSRDERNLTPEQVIDELRPKLAAI